MPTRVFELASFPHAHFDLAYLFLVLEEEAKGFAVACNLSGEGQVTDMFECGLEPVKVVSAELETPKIILGILRAFSLIVVRDCIQWSSVLRVVSRDDANDMRVRPHDHPSITRWNTPPPIVSDNTGHIIDPVIEIKA